MNELNPQKVRHPVLWVISNFVAMGIPFSMVIWVSTRLFKDLGHSDGEITTAVAAIGIVWSLKPFWAGFLDMFRTKKFFVVSTEFVIGVLFVLMGLALQLPGYFGAIIGLMWLVAFASATQDICSDGIYISSLNKAKQASFIGVQGMAWNLGRIIAVSGVVWVAGYCQDDLCLSPKTSWMYALFVSGAMMGLFGLYHMAILPTGSVPEEAKGRTAREIVDDFVSSAADFCNKRALWGMLAFVFFYRSSEGLLLIEAPLFMQGCIEDGALQVGLKQLGIIDGTVSTIVSILGGLLGGAFISRFTLKRSLFILALCVNVPNACYVYLSHAVTPANPLSINEIAFVVSMEKFWYGFGFVGNMLYMMQQIAPGKFKMTHYAFATAFMNLVLVPTQMASGPLADILGFKEFFWLVMAACAPSLVAAWFAPFPQLGAPDERTAVDDEGLLDDEDKRVQAAARRATIYAIVSIALFLFLDVLILGSLEGGASGAIMLGLLVVFGQAYYAIKRAHRPAQSIALFLLIDVVLAFALSQISSGLLMIFWLIVLALSTAIKVRLALKAIGCGREAVATAAPLNGGKAYVSNAKGAVIGGGIMLAVSLSLVVYCGRVVAGTDWACALSGNDAECKQVAAQPKRQCAVEVVDHGSLMFSDLLVSDEDGGTPSCKKPDVNASDSGGE